MGYLYITDSMLIASFECLSIKWFLIAVYKPTAFSKLPLKQSFYTNQIHVNSTLFGTENLTIVTDNTTLKHCC